MLVKCSVVQWQQVESNPDVITCTVSNNNSTFLDLHRHLERRMMRAFFNYCTCLPNMKTACMSHHRNCKILFVLRYCESSANRWSHFVSTVLLKWSVYKVITCRRVSSLRHEWVAPAVGSWWHDCDWTRQRESRSKQSLVFWPPAQQRAGPHTHTHTRCTVYRHAHAHRVLR